MHFILKLLYRAASTTNYILMYVIFVYILVYILTYTLNIETPQFTY